MVDRGENGRGEDVAIYFWAVSYVKMEQGGKWSVCRGGILIINEWMNDLGKCSQCLRISFSLSSSL